MANQLVTRQQFKSSLSLAPINNYSFYVPKILPKDYRKYILPGYSLLMIKNNFTAIKNNWLYIYVDPTGKEQEYTYRELTWSPIGRFDKERWQRLLDHCDEFGGVYFDTITGAFKGICSSF